MIDIIIIITMIVQSNSKLACLVIDVLGIATSWYRQKIYTSFDKLLSSCWSLYCTVAQMDMYCTCVPIRGQLQITNYTFNFGF